MVQLWWIRQSTNTNDSVTSPSSLRLMRLRLLQLRWPSRTHIFNLPEQVTARRTKVDLCNGPTSCPQQDNNCLEPPPLNARACLPKATCTHLFNHQTVHFSARRARVCFCKWATSRKLLLVNIPHATLERHLSKSNNPAAASETRNSRFVNMLCNVLFCVRVFVPITQAPNCVLASP